MLRSLILDPLRNSCDLTCLIYLTFDFRVDISASKALLESSISFSFFLRLHNLNLTSGVTLLDFGIYFRPFEVLSLYISKKIQPVIAHYFLSVALGVPHDTIDQHHCFFRALPPYFLHSFSYSTFRSSKRAVRLTFPEKQSALGGSKERVLFIGNGIESEAFLSGGDIFQAEGVIILLDESGGLINELDLFLE